MSSAEIFTQGAKHGAQIFTVNRVPGFLQCLCFSALAFISRKYLILAYYKQFQLIKPYKVNTCASYMLGNVNNNRSKSIQFHFYVFDNDIFECIFHKRIDFKVEMNFQMS